MNFKDNNVFKMQLENIVMDSIVKFVKELTPNLSQMIP